MKLIWCQRNDGLWNAACACNATICGVEFEGRAQAETWHFNLTRMERAERFAGSSAHAAANQITACGPKLPEPNPNNPDPFVFA